MDKTVTFLDAYDRAEVGAAALPGLLSVEAAARLLGVSRTTLYQLMDAGHLPYHRFPGVRARRISPADVAEFVESCRVERH